MSLRAIDCWVNVNMGEMGRPDYLKEVAANYFKQGEDFFRDYSVDEMIESWELSFNYVSPVIVASDSHLQCNGIAAARVSESILVTDNRSNSANR